MILILVSGVMGTCLIMKTDKQLVYKPEIDCMFMCTALVEPVSCNILIGWI